MYSLPTWEKRPWRLLSWSKALVRCGKTIPANSESSPTHARIETKPRSAEANLINCPSCSLTDAAYSLSHSLHTGSTDLTGTHLKTDSTRISSSVWKVTIFNYLKRIIHVNSTSPRVKVQNCKHVMVTLSSIFYISQINKGWNHRLVLQEWSLQISQSALLRPAHPLKNNKSLLQPRF